MWVWMVAAALAEPVVTVAPDAFVTGSVVVGAPPDLTLTRVSDPVWVSVTDGGAATVTRLGEAGACARLSYRVAHPLGAVQWAVLQCPVADGVDQQLAEPGGMHSYIARWRVAPEGSGSRVTYTLRADPALPLPSFVTTRTTRASVERLLGNLERALGASP